MSTSPPRRGSRASADRVLDVAIDPVSTRHADRLDRRARQRRPDHHPGPSTSGSAADRDPASRAPQRLDASGFPQSVRIVGGIWKRSKLVVPALVGLRPTPDRVRETLFNWLGQDLSGWRCLDAFAGSGALGFEAASRGASQVVLLERDRRAAAILGDAGVRLHATQVRIEAVDALSWMARAAPASFELVFLDPPFDADLLAPALALAARLVVPDGLVYAEAAAPIDAATAASHGLRLHRQGRAGQVHHQLLQRSATSAAD